MTPVILFIIIILCITIFILRVYGNNFPNLLYVGYMVIFFLIVIFSILFLLYKKKDKYKDFKLYLFGILTLLTGILVTILIIYTNINYHNNSDSADMVIVYYAYVGIIEEYIKFSIVIFSLFIYGKNNDITNIKIGNFIKLYIIVSLTFGFIEIILIGLSKRFFTPLIHIVYIVIPFIFFSYKYSYKFIDLFFEDIGKKYIGLMSKIYFIAIILHTLFDLSLYSDTLHIFFTLLFALLGILSFIYYMNTNED